MCVGPWPCHWKQVHAIGIRSLFVHIYSFLAKIIVVQISELEGTIESSVCRLFGGCYSSTVLHSLTQTCGNEFLVVCGLTTNISLAVTTSDYTFITCILTFCGVSRHRFRLAMVLRLFIYVHSSIDSVAMIVFTDRILNLQHSAF